jgi:DNA-binding transcriptional MerR regulator
MPRRNDCPLPAGTINTDAAARVSGVHLRTLLRWIDRGVLTPEMYAGEAGSHRAAYAWRLHDLVAARTIGELRAAGLSAQRVRAAALAVVRSGEDLASARLWSDGRDAFRVLSGERLVSVLTKPGQCELFDLPTWTATVRRAFERELRRTRAA